MSSKCEQIHKLFNSIKRYDFQFDPIEIPKNGIYILFEEGELAHSLLNRIVRVGTHTGNNNLPKRLREHFLIENKDRSIFRKNIGRAILNKNKDDYLKIWELDLTTREAKNKYSKIIDAKRQIEIERIVSHYIQKNFSFAIFEINNKEKRLELESKLISTISFCDECKRSISEKWLGKYSTKKKIKENGLWLEQGLFKPQQLNDEDLEFIEKFTPVT
jgi:bifunctional DNA-binding transcriptional regulator/antitoxin component of YhaV-PrlF toxin-antitoxin module